MHRRRLLALMATVGASGCLRMEEGETGNPAVTETTSVSGTSTTTAETQTSSRNTEDQAESSERLSLDGSWPQFKYDAGNTGHHPVGSGPTEEVELVWTFERKREVPDYREQKLEWDSFIPVVQDSTAFVSSQDNAIYAVDVETGKERWRFTRDTDVTDSGDRKCTPAVVDGVVVAEGSGGHLYGLDVDTGDPEWLFRRNIGASPVTPTVLDGTIYTENEGEILAIDAKSGSIQWVRNDLRSLTVPAVKGEFVYVGDSGLVTETARIYALDATSGETLWSIEGPSIPGSVVAESLYAARKTDGNRDMLDGPPSLYRINRATGEIQWERQLPTQPDSVQPPTVADDKIFVVLDSGEIEAYNISDGGQEWRTVTTAKYITGNPVVVDGHVYFGSSAGVHCHRVSDGARQWSYPLDASVYTPTVLDNALLVGTNEGMIHAFRERNL